MLQFFCVICCAPHLQFKSLFCRYCQSKMFPQDFKIKERLEGGVKHFYLFEWSADSDLASRSLIYFLKNKPVVFFESLLYSAPRLSKFESAVVPGCSGYHELNHAKELAEALLKQKAVSRVLEAGLIGGVKMGQQKLKTREQRLKSNRIDVRKFSSAKNWIFVDDVLVSGGTFKAVSEAMFTKPQAIFTLFYKPYLKNKGFYDA